MKTRALLKENKAFGERLPSIRTLRVWSDDNYWPVLADMVDDGIFGLLDLEHDPNMKDIVKDEVTFNNLMLRFRSQLIVEASKRGSSLMPRNSDQFVRFMKMLQDNIDSFNTRMNGAGMRNGGSDPNRPANIHDIAEHVKSAGGAVTDETLARAAIAARKPKAGS